MAIFNSGKAKELSKSTKSVARVISSNGQKNVVKGTAKKPDINIIPKASQTRKVIKTYDKGQLVKKEKQGHDILGRPTTKQKTYVDGKVTSVVKRVAGNNKDTKIVREAGKKQVSKSPAMPKVSSIGVQTQTGKNKRPFLSLAHDNAGSCNKFYRKKNKKRY
jgi:hypothetical protein